VTQSTVSIRLILLYFFHREKDGTKLYLILLTMGMEPLQALTLNRVRLGTSIARSIYFLLALLYISATLHRVLSVVCN
jgi:hypothetical protein